MCIRDRYTIILNNAQQVQNEKGDDIRGIGNYTRIPRPNRKKLHFIRTKEKLSQRLLRTFNQSISEAEAGFFFIDGVDTLRCLCCGKKIIHRLNIQKLKWIILTFIWTKGGNSFKLQRVEDLLKKLCPACSARFPEMYHLLWKKEVLDSIHVNILLLVDYVQQHVVSSLSVKQESDSPLELTFPEKGEA